ncbi:MAG: MFS transporter, partial [Clostridiales Family XIII bacterium]|nr:MFS transporter [Clostridiales Family XIII bacterium]
LSDTILANFFKEAYAVNAQQRGFIEIPRESPGVIAILFMAAISSLGNVRAAVIAQWVSAVGMLVLGIFMPRYAFMLVFLFIYSSGVHMYIPLGDSIGLSLTRGESIGTTIGRFNSVRMAFMMLAGLITFVGFHMGWLDFEKPVVAFVASACSFALVAMLLLYLYRSDMARESTHVNAPFVVRKAYTRYYIICALFGGRKQIMIVYSPWVLIDLLGFKADTMSILSVLGSLAGIFFIPRVGRWIDRFGVRSIMMTEAGVFLLVYVVYGFLSKSINNSALEVSFWVFLLACLLNIADRMTIQMAMVRSIYLRAIAVTPEDVTPSLTMGMAIDHMVAVPVAYFCGSVWFFWGPEYVFLIAGFLSLANLLVARGIRLSPRCTAKKPCLQT